MKIFKLGPIALTNTLTTNLLNPPTMSGGINAGSNTPHMIIHHIRILNKTTGAVSFSLWLGASAANAAGTEVIGTGLVVAPNDAYDFYGELRIEATEFLVGGASANTSLTLTAEGIIGVA